MSKNHCNVEHKWCKYCNQHGCNCVLLGTLTKNIRKCPKRIAKETVSFRDILKSVSFNDIMTEMIKYWPDQESSRNGYLKVYTRLLTIKGVKTNLIIDIKEVINNGYKYLDVAAHRYDDKNRRGYLAIEFTPWNEWVTMQISAESLNNLSYAQIAAACLWELTFVGFNETIIQTEHSRLIKAFDSIKTN